MGTYNSKEANYDLMKEKLKEVLTLKKYFKEFDAWDFCSDNERWDYSEAAEELHDQILDEAYQLLTSLEDISWPDMRDSAKKERKYLADDDYYFEQNRE